MTSSFSSSLLFLLLSLSSLLPLLTAQTCGGAGFDISALRGKTLVAVINGYPWTVNPCGSVSGVPGITCTAQTCQGNTVVSTYNPANITWTAADNGLVQRSQNGDVCGGDGRRQNTLRFVCNPSASSAYISDAQEMPTCHYVLVIQTNLVCTAPSGLKSVGSTYVSDLCGGGAYPLSELLPNDITFNTTDGYTAVYVNPCNTVQSPNCAHVSNPTSVCQAYLPLSSSSTNVFQLAVYDPTRSVVQYTLLSNGINQQYSDGAYDNGYPRSMNITYLCSASTPTYIPPSTFTVVTAPTGQLLYSMTVLTPAVCGATFQAPTCGGAGVNLASIAGVQMSLSNYWYVSPCGNVLSSNAGGCAGQACQGGTNLGFYDPAVAVWTLTDNGVMQQIQDGLGCGGDGPRQTTLRFICNTTATSPYILQVNEGPQCHYTYEIITSAACGTPISKAVGQTYASDLCGGGAYNLNQVSPGQDITYLDGANFLFINPCGQTVNQSCSNVGASVCYAYSPINLTNPSNDYNLATWYPATAPIRYTLLSNGISQQHNDGWYCGSFVRNVTINYICNSAATSAYVSSLSQDAVNSCIYTITVQTSVVCSTAYTNTFASCGGAGYDLSQSVAGVELSFLQNDDNQYALYTINTCSSVAGRFGLTLGCNAQVCQTGYNLSYYDTTAKWIPADNGVLQVTQNGQACGSSPRFVTLRFVCNILSVTPVIIESGHYFVIVQTSAVCVQPANYRAVGSTYVSDLCGGGAYPLAQITDNDIVYPEGSPTYAYVFFSPCGSIKNASCGSISGPLDVSLCEAYTPLNYANPTNEYKIAQYDPVRAPVYYTVIPNGLVQYSAAGDFNNGYPRALNTTYICNTAATTPYITSYNSAQLTLPGGQQQLYQLVVQTSVVCGAPFQKQQCGYNGIDLSGLVGQTLSGYYSGANYNVAPCSTVHASASYGCTGQVCQTGYPLSYYDPLNTVWTQADYGLVQFNQDGVYCGTSFARASTIRYMCNPSATTAYLSNAGEGPVCHYTLTIQTSLACNQATTPLSPVAVPRTVGSTYVSDLCGGNAQLLTAVAPTSDITYYAPDGSYVLFINPCGAVRNTTCGSIGQYNSNPTVCQAYTPLSTTNSYMLAAWNPPSAPVRYTILSNGIMQSHQDGSFCGGNVRIVNIQYICTPSATTAQVTSFTTIPNICVHNITIATAAVCGTPFVPVCKALGYDLSSLASKTISAYLAYNYWSISPCGNVSNTLYPGCTGQVCQGGTVVDTYDPAIVTWTQADNGLVQFVQDGDLCGGDGFREGAIRFVCNPAATTAYISAAGENPTCHYTLTVQTAAVCPVQTTFKVGYGQPWVSDQCGGGAYDLTQLGFTDIVFPEGSPTYAYVFFNPCSFVTNTSCGELSSTSVCEAYTPLNYANPQNSYQIGVYDPARAPVTYTLIPNGLTQYYQSGAYNGGFPRAVNATFTCNTAATTPYITSYNSASLYVPGSTSQYTQLYQIAVQTSAVCGPAFQISRSCGTATYNLSSLIGQQLSIYDGTQYTYYLSPCGQVDVEDAGGCVGQVCQNQYTLSQYSPSLTTYVPADNGVLAITADGQFCSNIGPRQTTIRYICNSGASTPFISQWSEEPACRYTLEVQTTAVCNIQPSHAVGTSYVSDLCGGGMWDLTPLSKSDIVAFVDNQAYLFINPCGTVKNNTCNNLGASVCYGYLPLVTPPSNDYNIARYDPTNAPITYTLLSNGVMATHVDGGYCGNNLNIPRTVLISYICDSTKSSAQVTSYTSANCNYNITVATSVVCGAPYTVPPPSNNNGGGGGSSLSGGAIAGIVIGSVAGVLILLVLLYIFCCGCAMLGRQKKDEGKFDNMGARPVASGDAEPSAVEMSQVDETGEVHNTA